MNKVYAGIGSRETPAKILNIMANLAKQLSDNGFTLRSGGALGADAAFEIGSSKSEIYLPWKGYNSKKGMVPYKPSHEEIAKHFHPAWDKCGQGARKLHVRNLYILVGDTLDNPVDFVICWTKDGKDTGGTGLGIRVANHLNVPVFNLYHEDALIKLSEFLKQYQ